MPSPADAATLKGYYDATDAARVAHETLWGCGRLELLASPDLLARFRRQQQTWRETLQRAWDMDPVSGEALALVSQKAASMVRAWAALDAYAAEAGHRHVAPWVWEARLADGTVAAFVQTNAEASRVIAEGRFLKVFTLAEVAHVIDEMPAAFLQPADQIPGQTLTPSRLSYYRTSDNEIPWDDPIPFGAGAFA
jgi:hypothetical protein